ncbi:MAG TPA: nucleoside phosphorylase [Acidimicrobiales bacterium]|nr:nucleoside phosphorylase [Acidimicrobiales bacterium]
MPYPNFSGKHAHDALVAPGTFVEYWVGQGVLPAGFVAPGGVVMLYQRRLFDAVLSQGGVSPFAPRGRRHTAFLDLHTFDGTDGTVGVTGGFGIGAPAAANIVESLAAIGVTRFVSMGTAGALLPDLDAGDVVVCDRAIRDEGVSHHYLPGDRWAAPDAELTARLCGTLADAGLAPRTGGAWTIDAPFRETVAEARHYAEDGAAVVEMEAAAVFTVARFRGVQAASAFAVSDSLADGEWTPQFGDRRLAESLIAMVPAAVSALSGTQG